MKKSIVAGCIALALTAVAHAETWIMVMEAKEGARLLVDVDSFGAKQWPNAADASKPGPIWIAARYMFYGPDGAGVPFIYTTALSSCKSGNGELVYQEWDGKSFANKGRYWWSSDGQKMYDAGGVTLCAIAKEVTAPTKQKSSVTGKDTV